MIRQVERFDVSPVEQELALIRWCQKQKVSIICLDGDDTLWKTVPIFGEQLGIAFDLLASTGIMSREEWEKNVRKTNDELYEKHGVNPSRWQILVDRLKEFGVEKNKLNEVLNIFLQIYQIPPVFIEGTEDGLGFLKRAGIEMGVVTHANRDWTRRKYEWLRLDRFFKWEDIYIVDENGLKTKESWQKAMRYFGVKPQNCAVVGDSPRSDINPACELGVGHCFWVQNEGYKIWSVQKKPMDELKVRRVRNVNDLRWLGREMIYSE